MSNCFPESWFTSFPPGLRTDIGFKKCVGLYFCDGGDQLIIEKSSSLPCYLPGVLPHSWRLCAVERMGAMGTLAHRAGRFQVLINIPERSLATALCPMYGTMLIVSSIWWFPPFSKFSCLFVPPTGSLRALITRGEVKDDRCNPSCPFRRVSFTGLCSFCHQLMMWSPTL